MLEDHHRAVAAVIRGLPPDWKRSLGRPSHTWLRAVEADLGQHDIGLGSARRKAAIRDDWRRIVCGHSNAPAEYALKVKKSCIHLAVVLHYCVSSCISQSSSFPLSSW